MQVKVYSVAQINHYIQTLLENDFVLNSFWIKGEISNFKAHSSGHLYFTLKDASASIQCMMFRGEAEMLPFLPKNGMLVVICGYVSVYSKTGQYQLYAEYIEPLGIGSLALSFEQLKQKLEEEGLFDEDYKREICAYPKCIAVVTSPTGAAVRDVIKIIKRRNQGVKIIVVPVLVQGEYAADSIVQGIKLANQCQADTIIVGRGGGSMEDLSAFNEEKVARAIFASETPVISAVGHETDFTIADFVADVRASTPSMAAEIAVKNVADLSEQLQYMEDMLKNAVENKILEWKNRLEFIMQSHIFMQPLDTTQKQKIEQMQKRIEIKMLHCLQTKQMQYRTLKKRLEASSPFATLKRGYVLTQNEKGETLTSMKKIQKNDALLLHFQDGILRVMVQEIVKTERSFSDSGEEKMDI